MASERYDSEAGLDRTGRRLTDMDCGPEKIRARAIRRAGQLLNAIAPSKGANQNIRDGDDPKVTRKNAAQDAGMSERQQKQAQRVANVPENAFSEQLNGEKPPTISALANQGKGPASVKGHP